MLLPFLLVPLVLTLTSAFAMQLQLVPLPTHFVEWTVPILMSGYEACGSVSGSLLQLFNLILGDFAVYSVYSSERKPAE